MIPEPSVHGPHLSIKDVQFNTQIDLGYKRSIIKDNVPDCLTIGLSRYLHDDPESLYTSLLTGFLGLTLIPNLLYINKS